MKKFLGIACVIGVTLSSISARAERYGTGQPAPKPQQETGLRNEDYGNKPSDSRAPASANPSTGNAPSLSAEQLQQAKQAVEGLRKAQERQQQALDALMKD